MYIDLDTGEIIENYNKTEYTIIRTIKTIKKENYVNKQTNEGHSKGIVTRTNECRRKPRQSRLW